jgi:hypothetical protein
MEAFKKTIARRMGFAFVFFIIVLAINIARMSVDFGTIVPERVWSFTLGLMAGAELILVYTMVSYIRALHNDDVLKTLYVAEADERNVMIRTKTGGMAVNIIMGALVCAGPIAGIWIEVVFYTLFATLLFVALLKGTLKLYYKKKL